jgi:hypothetical protein
MHQNGNLEATELVWDIITALPIGNVVPLMQKTQFLPHVHTMKTAGA